MPTFREDLHVGHKVPLVETDDIMDGGITTDKLADRAVTNPKIGDKQVSWQKLDDDLQNIIASREEGGVALSNEFGDSELIGITQKKLTETIDAIQDKIDKLHPGSFGITMSATPNIVYQNTGAEVSVLVKMVDGSTADSIVAMVGDEVVASVEDDSQLSFTLAVESTTTIKAIALQKGLSFDAQTVVTGVLPYYVGAGSTYHDVVIDEHKKPIKANPYGTYIVNVVEDGDYIFFVIPNNMTIHKATMSGFDFPLDAPQSVDINGNTYYVYQSSNTYDASELTIVIS